MHVATGVTQTGAGMSHAAVGALQSGMGVMREAGQVAYAAPVVTPAGPGVSHGTAAETQIPAVVIVSQLLENPVVRATCDMLSPFSVPFEVRHGLQAQGSDHQSAALAGRGTGVSDRLGGRAVLPDGFGRLLSDRFRRPLPAGVRAGG